MTEDEVYADVKSFLEEKALKGQGTVEGDTPLLEWGVLDSLTIIQLVAHVEDRFGIVIPSDGVVGTRFRDLNSICAFVRELGGSEPVDS